MSEHVATVNWSKQNNDVFVDNRYSRVHEWTFDGGSKIQASPSPAVVPEPYSDSKLVDPEEAFVASLSSCHMLFFLHFAAKEKLVVEEYIDQARGTLARNESGAMSFSKIELHPKIKFSGLVSDEQISRLHDKAHHACFLANSVKTPIVVLSESEHTK